MKSSRIVACCWLLATVMACSAAPDDPLEEARELQADGHLGASIPLLRKLLDEDPSQAEANFLLGVALSRTGQLGLAIWPLRKATESPEFAFDAGMLLARAMLDSRTPSDALEAVDRVLQIAPDNVNALVLRVQAKLALGDTEAGLADIDRVLELDPDNLAVLVPRVTALIAAEKIDEAQVALETARERLELTEQDVPPGTRPRLCIARGMFAFEKGDREAADAQYTSCLEKHPLDTLVVSEAARFYDLMGEGERATELLRSAYENSKRSVFRVALARRLGALGDPVEQLRLLREDAQARNSPMAWFAVADFHVGRQEFDEALPAFEKALAASKDPGPKLRFAYADTLVQANQYAKAREVVAQLEQPQLRALIRGRILLGEGDAHGALAAFEEGIRLWPNNAGGRYLAGVAAERVGDFERAVSEYRESIRADASATEAGLALARLYEARGFLDDAIGVAGRYVGRHRGDPEGYVVTIRIAHRARRHDVAAEGLRLLSLIPGQQALAVVQEAALVAEDRGPERAIEAIEVAALDLTDPANASALRALVGYLGEHSDHARALDLAMAAVDAHAEEAAFESVLGFALDASGEADAAAAAYERALVLDASEIEALSALAESAARAEDTDRALSLFERAAQADPGAPLPALRAAALHREKGDVAAARERLEALLVRRPHEANALLALAHLMADSGEADGAIAFAESAAWLNASGAEELLTSLRATEDPATPEPDGEG
jgi:tetratricopeptide (TPR) repeat protein